MYIFREADCQAKVIVDVNGDTISITNPRVSILVITVSFILWLGFNSFAIKVYLL